MTLKNKKQLKKKERQKHTQTSLILIAQSIATHNLMSYWTLQHKIYLIEKQLTYKNRYPIRIKKKLTLVMEKCNKDNKLKLWNWKLKELNKKVMPNMII